MRAVGITRLRQMAGCSAVEGSSNETNTEYPFPLTSCRPRLAGPHYGHTASFGSHMREFYRIPLTRQGEIVRLRVLRRAVLPSLSGAVSAVSRLASMRTLQAPFSPGGPHTRPWQPLSRSRYWAGGATVISPHARSVPAPRSGKHRPHP